MRAFIVEASKFSFMMGQAETLVTCVDRHHPLIEQLIGGFKDFRPDELFVTHVSSVGLGKKCRYGKVVNTT